MSNTYPACYLDGNVVDASVIDSSKHKYIGMFRPAPTWYSAEATHSCNTFCIKCGQYGSLDYHYNKGCYDVPQYITICNPNEVLQPVDVNNLPRYKIHRCMGNMGFDTNILLDTLTGNTWLWAGYGWRLCPVLAADERHDKDKGK